MRVFIAGIDGYLGWPLALHLTARGHEVFGADNYSRRRAVNEVGSCSGVPIESMPIRRAALREAGRQVAFCVGDMTDYDFTLRTYQRVRPEAIVYLAEQPSAPYSMIDHAHASETQRNNVLGTLATLHAMHEVCPWAHLLKLGTMGEYGTPNLDVPEGFFDVEYRGRKDRLWFPRSPGSYYHLTKVHDSHNVWFTCKNWGVSSTDIMQGVVYGTRIEAMGDDPRLRTRFDYDQHFGTAVNRFVAQAVLGIPMTPYGRGDQQRGFLPLCDSIQCFTLALENPPEPGEYRVLNQFEEVYSINDLAKRVKQAAQTLGLDATIRPLENPRREAERHYYNPDRNKLLDLGYVPRGDIDSELRSMIEDLLPYRRRLDACREACFPSVRWDGQHRKSEYLESVTPP